MPQQSMDNPYQPPIAPLMGGTTDGPVDHSVTIDSPKGPVRLETRGKVITITFGDLTKVIPAEKFTSSVIFHFTRTKRISFKVINLFAVTVSEEKFLAVLEFYGIDRFKNHESKSQRMLHAFFGLVFIVLGISSMGSLGAGVPNSWSLYDLGLVCFGILSFVLYALAFTRLFLVYCLLSALAYLLLASMMVLLWYTQGDWWVFIVLFFIYFSISTNLERFFYFCRVNNSKASF